MQLTILKTFDNYFSANITLTKLQDAGINCFLKDEFSATVNPVFNNAIGGIKLLVSIDDAEEASDLLIRFEEEYLNTIICPKCGKTEIDSVTSIAKKNFVENFLARLFYNNHVSVENIYKCRHCGWKSKTLPENVENN